MNGAKIGPFDAICRDVLVPFLVRLFPSNRNQLFHTAVPHSATLEDAALELESPANDVIQQLGRGRLSVCLSWCCLGLGLRVMYLFCLTTLVGLLIFLEIIIFI